MCCASMQCVRKHSYDVLAAAYVNCSYVGGLSAEEHSFHSCCIIDTPWLLLCVWQQVLM